MNRRRTRLATIAAAALLVVGCSRESKIPAAFLNEPLLKAPPGATQLERIQHGDRSGGVVQITSDALVKSVFVSPETVEEVAAYYRGVDPLLRDEGSTDVVLVTESKLRRVEVRIDTAVPFSDETGKPYVAPRGAKTFVTVSVRAPIFQ